MDYYTVDFKFALFHSSNILIISSTSVTSKNHSVPWRDEGFHFVNPSNIGNWSTSNSRV